MNTKLALALLSVGCAAAMTLAQPARADSFSVGWSNGWHHHHSGYSVSLGVGGPGYYGGYYAPAYYRPSRYCFYDEAGYYECQPRAYYPGYYGAGYYAPAIGISYYNGWGPGWGWNRWGWNRGWGGGWRGHDHDGDGWRGRGWDHDGRPGGWDRGHFHNGDGDHWNHSSTNAGNWNRGGNGGNWNRGGNGGNWNRGGNGGNWNRGGDNNGGNHWHH